MIGALLRDWRTMQRLTINQAAALIGVTPGMVSRLEKGRTIDSENMLVVIAWLFRTAPAEGES